MNKRLTNEEFLKRLQKVHPGYTALSKYQKASVKVTIKCDKGHVFNILPSNLISQGVGCKKCSYIEKSKAKTWSNEKFLSKLQKTHPGYIALEKYQGVNAKLKFKCDKGHVFQSTPSSLLNSDHSCSICSNIQRRQHQRLTNDEFVEKLRIKHPGYVALEKYVDAKTKIKVKCNQGHIFETTPNNLFNKKIGCPKCAFKHLSTINKLSNDEFLKRLQKVHPNYTALEDYQDSDTKIKIQCDQGHIFSVVPSSLINQGTGCPICADEQRSQRALMSNEEFLKRLHKVHSCYTALEKYQGISAKIKFQCDKGHIFIAAPNSIVYNGSGCPKCGHLRIAQKQKMPENVFINRLHELHPNINLISKYTKASDKLIFKCLKCGNTWQTYGTVLLKKTSRGCPNCYVPKYRKHKPKLMPNEKFTQRLHTIHPDWNLASDYKGCNKDVLIKCEKGHIFKTKANYIKQARCPECLYIERKQYVVDKLAKTHPGYKLIKGFATAAKKATFMCDKGHVFTAQVSSVICKTGCSICKQKQAHLNQRTSQDEYNQRVHQMHPNWQILTPYKTMKSYMKFKCDHGHIFTAQAQQAFKSGCPKCIASTGEEQIMLYFKKHHIKYEYSFKPATCLDRGRLHYDFKVGDILIEYQGHQHYEPVSIFGGQEKFELQQRHDQIKREWAVEHGYREIEIKYDQNINKILDQLFDTRSN